MTERTRYHLLALVVATALPVATQANEVDIPGVPVSVTDPRGEPAANEPAEREQGGESASKSSAANSRPAPDPDPDYQGGDRQEITTEFGSNKLLVISQGHPNRLVAPWRDPEVRTAHDAEIQVEGRVIYVTTEQSAPITLYVTDGRNEERALSLTLVPRRVPPREYGITVAGMRSMESLVEPDKAGSWERANPVRESVNQALVAAAKGEIPPGYGMSSDIEPQAMPIFCRWGDAPEEPGQESIDDHINLGTGQRLEGRNLTVWVAPVRNDSDEPIEVVGPECYHSGILAVSSYPRAVVRPGEKTELYIVERRAPTPSGRERPSAIGAGAWGDDDDD